LIVSPSFGDDVILKVYRTGLRDADGTLIQSENAPFLLKDDSLAAYYMLFSKETVIIGAHAYAFDVVGDKHKIYYLKDGSVRTGWLLRTRLFSRLTATCSKSGDQGNMSENKGMSRILVAPRRDNLLVRILPCTNKGGTLSR
jgi:hypothetical protein